MNISSDCYAPFIYQKLSGTKNINHCGMHCYFDPEEKCAFYFLQNDECYLGNFNVSDPISSNSFGTITIYISQGIFMKWEFHILSVCRIDLHMLQCYIEVQVQINNCFSSIFRKSSRQTLSYIHNGWGLHMVPTCKGIALWPIWKWVQNESSLLLKLVYRFLYILWSRIRIIWVLPWGPCLLWLWI